MLSPFEEKITQFVGDEVMFDAVKNVLAGEFEINSVIERLSSSKHPFEVTNQVLGEVTRACNSGRSFLERGFRELAKYRKEPTGDKEIKNPV